ncbi:MAG: putative Ig domain-containing protein [Methanocorpusculum sp.]|nr:putative Ig domain-containing protein [Methanocorpusculum sp.]
MAAKVIANAPKVTTTLASRAVDPSSTVFMVTVMDPNLGGIWCVDGKDSLPVGGTIWSRDPEKDAGWIVKYQENPNTPEILVPHEDWRPIGFDLTKPGLTIGNITATINGVDKQCYRALLVTATESEAGQSPVITDTAIPNGFVGIPYVHKFSVSAATSLPVLWSAAAPLPEGLVLDTNTGTLSGTPVKSDTADISVRALNAYGAVTKSFSFRSLGPYELDITPLKTVYTVGEEIQPADLVVKYNGRVIPMDELTGYVLKYNPDTAGTQTVRAAYDPHLEEVGDLARGEYQVTFNA